MDLGQERAPYVIEPVEDPVPREAPRERDADVAREPEPTPGELVPA
jgi:hypothetical protein